MISVQDALTHIRSVRPRPTSETVPITKAMGRVLAQDITARIDMPPFSTANMDGYALSHCSGGDQVEIIGDSAAGHPFPSDVLQGTAVRISTGAMMPSGTDRVLIREDANLCGKVLTVNVVPPSGRHVRVVASDFAAGDTLVRSGLRLAAADLTLAAAAGHAQITVNRKLNVAVLSSGDELRMPGSDLNRGEIYSANAVGLKPLLESWGTKVTHFGIVGDGPDALASLLPSLAEYDVIIPIGGASVGDHDHMRPSFREDGFELSFETVAIRPGKPSWMGKKDDQIVFGLPGNPASTFVCAHLFLRPLLGQDTAFLKAILGERLEENGPRETYLRARASLSKGQLSVTPDIAQDSYRMRPQSTSNALIRVPPMGGPYEVEALMDILLFGDLAPTE